MIVSVCGAHVVWVFNLQNRIILRDYSSSVAVRGILHSNSHQVSVGFRPLHKPAWLQVSTKVSPASCRG